MTPKYDLIDEPWIPCQLVDGRTSLVGIADAFRLSESIRHIHDPSPLVTVALYRLLLAILYRTQAPANPKIWRAMVADGWDLDRILSYLDSQRGGFDLFSPGKPFMQRAGFTTKARTPVSKLAPELAAGNNALLFEHSMDEDPVAASAAEAARRLVATQACVLGGGKSETGYTTTAPLAKGLAVLVTGNTLTESLLANLVPVSLLQQDPYALYASDQDLPCWERPCEDGGGTRQPRGCADLYTWQSRVICLIPEADNSGQIIVKRVFLGQGTAVPDSFIDPMHSARMDPKRGWVSLKINEDKAPWRESNSLFNTFDPDAHRPPPGLVLAGRRNDFNGVVPCLVAGVASDQAKIILWRAERFNLPAELLKDQDVFGQIHWALSLADSVAGCVEDAVAEFAREYESGGRANADKKAVRRRVCAISRLDHFWSALERPFHVFLESLKPGTPAGSEWLEHLRRQARGAFEASVANRETTARCLRAAALARSKFDARLATKLPKEEPDERTNADTA